jgi:outer membrane protein TolC
LPQINFNGTLPNFNRSFTGYINSDGSQSYVNQQFISFSGNLEMTKTLGFTGGSLFLSSGLQRVDNIYDSLTTKNYLSTPISFGISQPLFNYNPYKWSKQIEPIKYQESQRVYVETVEQVAITGINYFFGLMKSQLELQINQINVLNYDTLLQMAKGRYQLGKIEENDLLQLELNYLQSKSSLEMAQLNYENAVFRFKSFLRISQDAQIVLQNPQPLAYIIVDKEIALQYALKNSAQTLQFETQLLQANANLDKASKENGFNANLYAVFGLTQNAPNYQQAYNDPSDQQNVNLGIQVPLYDWGLRKGQLQVAQSNLEIVKSNVEQARIDFAQKVYLQVAKFNMQQNQLFIAAKSDTIAQKSYEITKQRYYLGKITVTDLNIAQESNDRARLAYLSALQTYWEAYFQLRKNTLFDFEKNAPIEVDFNTILNQ